jgi:hypothetical protein
MPVEHLEARICELAGHLTAATCQFLLLIADFDARQGWASWEMPSCAAWLSWKCQIASGTAREHVRVARAEEEDGVSAETPPISHPAYPGRCHIDDGPAISPATVQLIGCNATISTMVHDTDGNVLDVGRRTRKSSGKRLFDITSVEFRPGRDPVRMTGGHHRAWGSSAVLPCTDHAACMQGCCTPAGSIRAITSRSLFAMT